MAEGSGIMASPIWIRVLGSFTTKAALSTAAQNISPCTPSPPAWSRTASFQAIEAASCGSPGARHAQISLRIGEPMSSTK
jgi:hypothetical protein